MEGGGVTDDQPMDRCRHRPQQAPARGSTRRENGSNFRYNVAISDASCAQGRGGVGGVGGGGGMKRNALTSGGDVLL